MSLYFDFYGLVVEVQGSERCLEDVRRDFAYFLSTDGPTGLLVEMREEPPPYDQMPAVPAAFLTPRNACFRDGATTYLDYFGRALGIYARDSQRLQLYSLEPHLLHEAVYLFLLSSVGQYLDGKGRHRLHALGVSHHDQGLLLLLPSGGGKSTMALSLLDTDGFLLISEDSPLVDRRAVLHPFPLRIGVRPDAEHGVPDEHIRTVPRMEFDPKTLIDIEYFRDRLAPATPARWLLVGERNLGDVSDIVPLARPAAFSALFKNMVVGLGIYQGMEFILERGLGDLAGKGGAVLSRLRSATALLRRATPYRFVLGRNRERNRETLLRFLDRQD